MGDTLVVRSWDGGENSIDASSTPGGREKIIRDSWDQQLDRGKVRMEEGEGQLGGFDTSSFLDQMKDGKTKTSKSEFSSDKNFFQEQQNKRNVSPCPALPCPGLWCSISVIALSFLQKGESQF